MTAMDKEFFSKTIKESNNDCTVDQQRNVLISGIFRCLFDISQSLEKMVDRCSECGRDLKKSCDHGKG